MTEEEFWTIVDHNGPSGLPSDQTVALMMLVNCWDQVQALKEAERGLANEARP